MDRQKLLKDVQVMLKSMINSNPKCIYLREVPSEYLKCANTHLPYRELGFATPEELYKQLDEVYIESTRQGPVLLAKQSEATAHLDKLVKGQKDNSQSKYIKNKPSRAMIENRGGRPPPLLRTFPHGPFHQPPARHLMQGQNLFSGFTPRPPFNSMPYVQPAVFNQPIVYCFPQAQPQVVPQPRYIPQQVVDAVRATTSLVPTGLSTQSLQLIIMRKFSIKVDPSQYFFNSWGEFIGAMPHVACMRYTEQGEQIFPVTTSKLPSPAHILRQDSPKEEVDVAVASNVNQNGNILNTSCEENIKSSEGENDTSENDLNAELYNSTDKNESTDLYSDDFALESGSDSVIGEKVKAVLKQVMDEHPDGLSVFELLDEYRRFARHALQLNQYGFSSVYELVDSAPDVFYLECHRNGDDTLYPASRPPKREEPKEMEEEREVKRLPVSNGQLLKMLQVVSSYSAGVPLDDFYSSYKMYHSESFKIDDSSCGSALEALFSRLNDYFVIHYRSKNFVCVSTSAYGSRWMETQLKMEPTFMINRRKNSPSAECKIPDDAVTNNEVSPLPPDFSHFEAGSFYDVVVCCVHSPDKFHIHLNSQTSLLEDLIGEMNETYNNKSLAEKYSIPPSMVKVGLLCAACQEDIGDWSRAYVTSIDGNEVDIAFFDFGNTATVRIFNLKFLRDKFVHLPFFGFQAQLSDVEGTCQRRFTQAANKRFSNLCQSKRFTAKVNTAGTPLSVDLFNSSGSIRRILQSEGHALLTGEDDETSQMPYGLNVASDDSRRSRKNSDGVAQFCREKLVTSTPDSTMSSCSIELNNLSLSSESAMSSARDEIRCVRPSDISNRESSSGCSSVANDGGKSFSLMNVSLSRGNVHVIRFAGQFYLPTFEVSHFFWKVDFLKQLTVASGVDAEFVPIHPTDQPALFEKLQKLFNKPSTSEYDLVPLQKLPYVLSEVMVGESEMTREFAELAEMFC